MPARRAQILLVTSFLWISWLLMMLIHESGHVLGAVISGGVVRHVIWSPLALSRTDVQPNPHPLFEVWAGPIFGATLPLAIGGLLQTLRRRVAYLMWAFAGFCLIANGAYIGVGSVVAVGDAKQLVALGMARWTLAIFGLLAAIPGMWIWDRISPQFGFGPKPAPINSRHAYGTFVAATLVTVLGILLGNPGT
ncbi:MAG TPA: hypothetical protein VG722_05865 [Tepidisphaeraceae bacterium]|nr:hypothetical protein [Tepidisphaeraceae bacterium]